MSTILIVTIFAILSPKLIQILDLIAQICWIQIAPENAALTGGDMTKKAAANGVTWTIGRIISREPLSQIS